MSNSETTINNIGIIIADVVQKKLTPFKNPKNSGGSPRGVNDPPIFATKKMKNTITWTLCSRCLLALINGRINNIAAPVVPIQLAKIVPIKIMIEFNSGVPTSEPFKRIPPEIVNKASKSIINGM